MRFARLPRLKPSWLKLPHWWRPWRQPRPNPSRRGLPQKSLSRLLAVLALVVGTAALVLGAPARRGLIPETAAQTAALAGDAAIARDLSGISGLEIEVLTSARDALGGWGPVIRKVYVYQALADQVKPAPQDRRELIEAVKKGHDPLQILTLYQYTRQRGLAASEIHQPLFLRAQGKGWGEALAPLEERSPGGKGLSREEIREALAGGLTLEDILAGDQLALAARVDVRELLKERKAGRKWDELEAEHDREGKLEKARREGETGRSELARRLKEKGYHDGDIRPAEILAAAVGIDPEALLASVKDDYPLEQAARELGLKAKREREARVEAEAAAEIAAQAVAPMAAQAAGEPGWGQVQPASQATQTAIERYQVRGQTVYDLQNAARLAQETGRPVQQILAGREQGRGWPEILAQARGAR